MKRAKRCVQMRSRRKSLYRFGMALCIICAQWMAVDSAFVDAAAAGVAFENKVTSPSRNEATNPLKEPTPSTLQGAFLNSNNLTDVNNGSTSTPPAETSVAATTGAAAAETVLNVRTAAVATSPLDNADNNGSATAIKTDPATTDRPLKSWESVVRTSTEPPSHSPPPPPPRDPMTEKTSSVSDYGTDSISKNIMVVNMLKSWFKHKEENYKYGLASEYLQHDGADKSSKAAVTFKAAGGNKSLFERWDEASEEQKRALEDAMRTDSPYGDDGGSSSSSSSVLAADQNTPSRWFVLLLSGNSTVAQMRRTDFAKYLKLNLAARLSLEYDEIKINRVLVVPPRLMVNVSVVPVSERASAAVAAVAAAAASSLRSSSSSWSPSQSSMASDAAVPYRVQVEDDDPLHNLVETNATLMELSGEEYRVERFMSLKSQKPQTMDEAAGVVSNRHADIDYFIYATVGPLCFVVVFGFLLLTLYKYVRKHPVKWPWKRKFSHPSFWPDGGDVGDGIHHLPRHRRMTDECCSGGTSSVDEMQTGGPVNVIYSGEFEQSQQQQLSGSWLDDASFVPDDSLDRIRTPTLLRTTAVPPPPIAPPPAVCKNKTFTDMLQQCGDGPVGVVDDDHRQLLRHHRLLGAPLGGGQCVAAVAAVHAQSPRLSRDSKLRILGCKQSCLLLPAVQPATASSSALTTVAAIDEMTLTLPPPSQPTINAIRTNDDCIDQS